MPSPRPWVLPLAFFALAAVVAAQLSFPPGADVEEVLTIPQPMAAVPPVVGLPSEGSVIHGPSDATAPPTPAAPEPEPDVPEERPLPAARAPRLEARVDADVVLARLDRRFYGQNIADWVPQDYAPGANPVMRDYLKALEPGVLRWPAGHTSQSLVWERAPEAANAKHVLTASHVESFLRYCDEVGAQPLLAVNLKTGTPEAAADLVRYVNVERGHGVTWWQVGNEPDLRDGLTASPDDYAQRYLAFARAMKAVDPSIRLVGGEVMTGAHVMGTNGALDWMTPILAGAGGKMDAVSWHYYPLDSNQPRTTSPAYPTLANLFQEVARDWRPSGLAFADEVFPHLKRVRDQHAPGAEIWITEIAEDSGQGGAAHLVGRQAGALWTADVMGRFARHDPDAVVKFVFKSVSSHRFTLLDPDSQPRPAYYAYWLYAREWGRQVVDARSERIEEVAVHAALRDDGSLALVLVNKVDAPREVLLHVEGFRAARADGWTLTSSGIDGEDARINGQGLTPELALAGIAPEPLPDPRLVEMPAYSVRLVVLEPARA